MNLNTNIKPIPDPQTALALVSLTSSSSPLCGVATGDGRLFVKMPFGHVRHSLTLRAIAHYNPDYYDRRVVGPAGGLIAETHKVWARTLLPHFICLCLDASNENPGTHRLCRPNFSCRH